MTEPPARVTRPAALELASHPAGPQAAPALAGQAKGRVVEVRDQGDDLAHPRGSGVGPAEAIDHAEDHQQGGLEEIRDHRGELVVVAELDLVDADGVVLVDDRDRVVLEQGGQGIPHVEVAGPAVEILVSEQELGGVAAVAAEAFVVGPDQVGLANCGGGLELPEVVGPLAQSELANPRAHGPRADQCDPPARVGDEADLLGEVADPGGVEPAVGAGQYAGADLDDPGLCRKDHIVADQVAGHRRAGLSG